MPELTKKKQQQKHKKTGYTKGIFYRALLTSKLYHDIGLMQRGDSTIIVYCGKTIDIFITLKV